MLTHSLKTSTTQWHDLCGTIGAYLEELSRCLAQRGYQQACLCRRLRGAHRLLMWAEEAGIPLPALNDKALAAFQAHLYAHDGLKSPGAYAMQLSRGARDLIAFLATTGYIPPPVPLAPTSAAPALLVTFNGWMRTHRGTTETTLRNYRLP